MGVPPPSEQPVKVAVEIIKSMATIEYEILFKPNFFKNINPFLFVSTLNKFDILQSVFQRHVDQFIAGAVAFSGERFKLVVNFLSDADGHSDGLFFLWRNDKFIFHKSNSPLL